MKTKYMLLVMILVAASSVDAKMYKWVDEDGKVYYSDKVPPDHKDFARERLSETGVVQETIQRALTEEEKKAMAEELKQKRAAEAQAKLDAQKEAEERKKILMSYSSEDQIIRLKEERIAAITRNIETARENLAIQEKNHDDLMSRAADKERSGEKVSEAFLNQINQVKEQIAFQKSFIVEKTAEIEATETRYDEDLKKYLKYSGALQASEEGAETLR